MKVNIIFSTRYGSTGQIASWIAERFSADGHEAFTADASSAGAPVDADLTVMGSGIYSHGYLKPLEEYIGRYAETLADKKTALFGVAMKTEPIMHNGRSHGGILMLEKYAAKLGKSVIGCAMLHGQMIFSSMTDEDKEGLMSFYRMAGFSETETNERMKPRTMMNKAECWEFAENLIKSVNRIKQ